MRRRRGKKVMWAAGTASLLVLAAVCLALKEPLVQEYWVWRLDSGDEAEKIRAVEVLEGFGTERAISVLVDRMQVPLRSFVEAREPEGPSGYSFNARLLSLILESLLRLGDAAVPAVVEATSSEDLLHAGLAAELLLGLRLARSGPLLPGLRWDNAPIKPRSISIAWAPDPGEEGVLASEMPWRRLPTTREEVAEALSRAIRD